VHFEVEFTKEGMMVRSKRGIGLAIAVTVLFVCLSCAGKDFVRPTEVSLVLGKTTMQEIRRQFGEPRQEASGIENGEAIKTFVYTYAAGAGGLVGGVIPARAMVYSFYNDVLVAYQFNSSFLEDSTDFNEAKINQIKKGTTREGEVIDLIGKPSGRGIYPTADQDGKTLGYTYTETRGPTFSMKMYQKILRINLNRDGIVTNVKFSSSGTR